MSDIVENIARASGCEIRCDAATRVLYATDGSMHQVEPRAVAFPRTAAQTAAVMRAAAEAGIPISPRGAGTGLTGGALGDGLILDMSRYNRRIADFNREARTVRVGAGVVLDQLNAFLEPHGLMFGPDVATSSRATLGGMINNNSSGARAPRYGTTSEHLISLEAALPDGRIVELGRDRSGLTEHIAAFDALVQREAPLIRERFHQEICKRWPGYGLDRYLRAPGDLCKLVAGSEGTLATVFSAELRLVPLPASKGIGLAFFDSVAEAMRATVTLSKLGAAAIEHIDDMLFDQTKGQRPFKAAREMLELDSKPCKSILLVEFYEDEKDKLAEFERLGLGMRRYICKNNAEMARVWALRKAGLSLVTGCKGPARPIPGIEDAAVPVAKLPDYVERVAALMTSLGVTGSFYGHAGSGLLHIRAKYDIHTREGIEIYRALAEGVSQLVREFRGAISAEHGVGIERTEFMDEHVPRELLAIMAEIKKVFDPAGAMNPGKILDTKRYRVDADLRVNLDKPLELPFEPVLAFAEKDESFLGNLEQCNGCGGCRKDAPTMCPTFIVTGEEAMSTRGRANIIRAVLEQRLDPDTPAVLSEELEKAIGHCLSCKGCLNECPSNVNLALLKAELLHARHKRTGVPLAARVFSRVDLLGKLGCATPRLANATLENGVIRAIMARALGISPRRPLPRYTLERFDRWFHARGASRAEAPRGEVALWDDCFVRYNDPQIGQAAVRVLEAAGFRVTLPKNAACCGRPAFSMGRLDVAKQFGEQNAAALGSGTTPIVFLEPSCYSMFRQDYAELRVPGAEALAQRAFLFEDFVEALLEQEPDALKFKEDAAAITAIHAHCHSKALTDTAAQTNLLKRIPGNTVTMLDTGCCGMAGAFGALDAKYDLSVQVASPLVEKIAALAPGTQLVASGTSCRHQIGHLTPVKSLHAAEVLAAALR